MLVQASVTAEQQHQRRIQSRMAFLQQLQAIPSAEIDSFLEKRQRTVSTSIILMSPPNHTAFRPLSRSKSTSGDGWHGDTRSKSGLTSSSTELPLCCRYLSTQRRPTHLPATQKMARGFLARQRKPSPATLHLHIATSIPGLDDARRIEVRRVPRCWFEDIIVFDCSSSSKSCATAMRITSRIGHQATSRGCTSRPRLC